MQRDTVGGGSAKGMEGEEEQEKAMFASSPDLDPESGESDEWEVVVSGGSCDYNTTISWSLAPWSEYRRGPRP